MNKFLLTLCVVSFCAAQSFCQTIYNFEIFSKALLSNYPKLKQDEIGVVIAQENIEIANAEYYPSLKFTSNVERSKKFDSNLVSSYVGDDSLTESNGRYISASLYFSYELYRFGATDYSVRAAEEYANALSAAKCVKEKEYILSLLESYSKIRVANYQLEYYGQIQKTYEELYILTKRLHESGDLAKTNSLEYAEKLAQTAVTIAQIKDEKIKHISQIIYLSGMDLTPNDIFEPLSNAGEIPLDLPFEQSASAKQALSLIAQKQAEVDIRRVNYMPAVSFYARYDLYGSSNDNYNDALNEFKKNGYRFGISFSIPLFDGFRNDSEVNIKKLELTQSRLAYEDAKKAYEKERFLISAQIASEQDKIKDISESVRFLDEIVRDNAYLYDVGELDKITLLNNQINNYKTTLSLKEASELLAMNIKKREIMSEKDRKCAAR